MDFWEKALARGALRGDTTKHEIPVGFNSKTTNVFPSIDCVTIAGAHG